MKKFIQITLFIAFLIVAIFGAGSESLSGVFVWLFAIGLIGGFMYKADMFEVEDLKRK